MKQTDNMKYNKWVKMTLAKHRKSAGPMSKTLAPNVPNYIRFDKLSLCFQ